MSTGNFSRQERETAEAWGIGSGGGVGEGDGGVCGGEVSQAKTQNLWTTPFVCDEIAARFSLQFSGFAGFVAGILGTRSL